MKIANTEALGQWVREERKRIGATQRDLALAAGTGLRWIIDLEKGKETCQVGKVFQVLEALGTQMEVNPK